MITLQKSGKHDTITEKEGKEKTMCNYINCDSFGAHVPSNWEDIADAMNNYIEENGIMNDSEALCQLWDDYWSGLIDTDIIPAAEQENSGHKLISIDNGLSFTDPEKAIELIDWDIITEFMEDDTREKVADEMAPCSKIDFLNRYLEKANDNLIIG